METLKDIFVPYEIAVQLNEIGFEEECIAVHSKGKLNIFDPNDSVQWVMFEGDFFVPTWEQVKKWFREKGYFCNIHIIEGLEKTFLFTINKEKRIYESDLCTTYEEAQEQLILKLIEIYKNGK